MSKYIVVETYKDKQNNAGTKAPADCISIAKNNGYNVINIEKTSGNTLLSKIKRQLHFFNNWKHIYKTLKKHDILLFQYPFVNENLGRKHYFKKMKNKNIIKIMIIHDLDILRYYKTNSKDNKKLLFYIHNTDFIIAHNERMKNYLISLGKSPSSIDVLKVFDYLCDENINTNISQASKNDIIIAGNLDPIKVNYIKELDKLTNIKFNLYGINYQNSIKNSEYFGSFSPNDLPNIITGGFGLVWDGLTINSCIGPFGNYLYYNNPHKASLYLASGIPVIIWNKAAMADFIIKNKLGLAVDNLNDLPNILSQLSNSEYNLLRQNVTNFAPKIRSGYFLTNSLNRIELNIQYLINTKQI